MIDQSLLKRLIPKRLKWRIKRSIINLWESSQYALVQRDRIRIEKGNIHSLLFVCKGNVCRSPFAEYYLKSRIDRRAIRIDSCGIDVNQGGSPPDDAVRAALGYGIDLQQSVSESIKNIDISAFNAILVFDMSTLSLILRDYPQVAHKAFLLRKLSTVPQNMFCNIDDPYGQGLKEFKRCYENIIQAVDSLVCRAGIII